MATKLKTLPAGHRIIETAHGNYIQKQKRSRKTFKMPKAQRQKIAAAARRFKFPILTAAAIGVPLAFSIAAAQRHGGLFSTEGAKWFGSNMLAYYTGFAPMTQDFEAKRLMYGLVPLIATMVLRRSGITKAPNAMLAKMRIPLRLS